MTKNVRNIQQKNMRNISPHVQNMVKKKSKKYDKMTKKIYKLWQKK